MRSEEGVKQKGRMSNEEWCEECTCVSEQGERKENERNFFGEGELLKTERDVLMIPSGTDITAKWNITVCLRGFPRQESNVPAHTIIRPSMQHYVQLFVQCVYIT